MKNRLGNLSLIGLTLLMASVAPNIFPAAEAGYGNMSVFAKEFLIPSIIGLVIIGLLTRKSHPAIARSIGWGGLGGGIATGALEAVRIVGFHLGYMPGSLPKLMGVLLLNRFMLGPDLASNLAGWGYHFWNGAVFGIIFVMLIGTRRVWAGVLYGLAIGTGFMLSPVVRALGVGYFGLQFSPGFPVVVYLAHVAYGLALGLLARQFLGPQPNVAFSAIGKFFHPASTANSSESRSQA